MSRLTRQRMPAAVPAVRPAASPVASPPVFQAALRIALAAGSIACAATAARAQAPSPAPEIDAGAVAIRCELRTIRAPDATQVLYFYVSDTRRAVLETDGNPLGNVVQFSRQRIVITRPPQQEGGIRSFVFDRLLGSLTITGPAPMQSVSRDPMWTMSGECVRVDASKPRF